MFSQRALFLNQWMSLLLFIHCQGIKERAESTRLSAQATELVGARGRHLSWIVLLVAAGLFTKSLVNVSRINLGVKGENVISFRLSPALNGYTSDGSTQLFERTFDEFAAMPV